MNIFRWIEGLKSSILNCRERLCRYRLLNPGFTVLLAGILLLCTAPVLNASDTDWESPEETVLTNGLDAGGTTADDPGELSVSYGNGSNSRVVTSPDTVADTSVNHLSLVRLTSETDTLAVSPGGTFDLGLDLVNRGNGPDSYALRGVFADTASGWDTAVHLDTDRDGSSDGESVVQRVRDLDRHGKLGDDTGLVVRFDVPDTASDDKTFTLRSQSTRTSDPEPGTDAAQVALSLEYSDVVLENLEILSPNQAVLADGSGTFGVKVTWKNAGTADTTIQVDPNGLEILDEFREEVTAFDYTLTTEASPEVPAGDTVSSIWSVQTPEASSEKTLGLFKVNYGSELVPRSLNVARPVLDGEVESAGEAIDQWTLSTELFGMKLGVLNSAPALDDSVISTSDRGAILVQRGDSTYLENPIVNPDHEYASAKEFRNVLQSANEKLRDREAQPVRSLLYNISIWKNSVGGTYIGDNGVLQENTYVSIEDPTSDTVTPQVAKLLPEKNRWIVVDPDPVTEEGRVRFRVSGSSEELGAGFSVFRILSGGGVEETGSASKTMVYPNPFVPFDGRDETGEYGHGPDQGLYFAAGEDVGFPAGTHLAIYTVTGDHVFEKTTTQGGIIRWNPRTHSGDPVASGVYVYRITTPDGSEKVGKFSIVR